MPYLGVSVIYLTLLKPVFRPIAHVCGFLATKNKSEKSSESLSREAFAVAYGLRAVK